MIRLGALFKHFPIHTHLDVMGSENEDTSEERPPPSTFTQPSGKSWGKICHWTWKEFCGILSHLSPYSPLRKERLKINLFYVSPQFTAPFSFRLNFRYYQLFSVDRLKWRHLRAKHGMSWNTTSHKLLMRI